MGVTVTYKGNTIANMDASGTKILNTAGTYCEGNININYTAPASSASTLIAKTITDNGIYNPISDNADGFSNVTVNLPFRKTLVTIDSDKNTKTYLTDADADIASHRTDSNFWILIIPLFGYSSGLSFRGGFNTLRNLHEGGSDVCYGILYRTTSSGASSSGWITKAVTSSSSDIGVDSTGKIFIYATSTIILRTGSYLCFCGW